MVWEKQAHFMALTRFIERNVTVFSDAAEEEFDTTHCLDGFLVRFTFSEQIGVVPIQNVNVFGINIDCKLLESDGSTSLRKIRTHYVRRTRGTCVIDR
jgi:hypothetical protein